MKAPYYLFSSAGLQKWRKISWKEVYVKMNCRRENTCHAFHSFSASFSFYVTKIQYNFWKLKQSWRRNQRQIKCILEICHLTDNDGNGFAAQMAIMFPNYIIIIQMQVTLPCISLNNCLYTRKNRFLDCLQAESWLCWNIAYRGIMCSDSVRMSWLEAVRC